MAVPFYLPEGGPDDTASNSSGPSGSASTSSGASSSGSSDGASSVASQSPNTTTSATQTPMQSPLSLPAEQVFMALCEWYQQQRHYNYNANTSAPQIFQYPPPPSPSCSMAQSPSYTGGDIFFGHGMGIQPPPSARLPHTSVSFPGACDEFNFFRQHHPPPPSTPQPMPPPPQSAPPLHYSHSYPQQSPVHMMQHRTTSAYAPGAYYATYTPPPTPSTGNPNGSSSSLAFGWQGPSTSTPLTGGSSGAKMRLQRSQSDAARRKRLTSTGEDEREYQSDHETSWDEFEDRYDNFTAGRERLQEFNGRIPPHKKKNSSCSSPNSGSGSASGSGSGNHSHPCGGSNSAANNNKGSSNISNNHSNHSSHSRHNSYNQHSQHQQHQQQQQTEQKKQSFTWPTVITVFVLAMGCGFFAAR